MKESPLLKELEDIRGSTQVSERGRETTVTHTGLAPPPPVGRRPDAYLDHHRRAVRLGIIGGILIVIGGVSNFNALEFLGIQEGQVIDMAKGTFGEMGGLVASLIFLLLQVTNFIGGFMILGGVYAVNKERLLAGKILMDLGVGLGLIGFIILLFISTTQAIRGAGIGIAILTIIGTLVTLLSLAELRSAKKALQSETKKIN